MRIILVLLLFIFTSFNSIFADIIFEKSGITYKICANKTVNIVATDNYINRYQTYKDSLLVIPAIVNYNGEDYRVRNIEKSAFACWVGINKVIISDGIEGIQDNAFEGCANVQSVTIPKSISSLGERVFSYCIRLDTIVVDTENPIFDSRNRCNAIIRTEDNSLVVASNSTIIPESVEFISSYAYTGLSLKIIDIPKGVGAIEEYAIFNCSDLERINISSTVEYICAKFLQYCDNVKSIIVDVHNTEYDSRSNCNAVIETSMNKLICGCNLTVIPQGVSIIGNSAFMNCSRLRFLDIPEGVISIEPSAFWGCYSLEKVSLPSSLSFFEGHCHFAYCTILDSIFIPKNVIRVPSDIFYGCLSLEQIIVDRQNLKYDSRNSCNAVICSSTNELVAGCKKTKIVNGVKSIAENAFTLRGITSIYIPESVDSIAPMAFYSNENCKIISVDERNPKFMSGNSNSIIDIKSNKMILACSTTKFLPRVKSIASYAFINTPNILVVPSGIEIIDKCAFINNKDLLTVFLPTTVKSIGKYAFARCSNLENVILMGGSTQIDKDAFFATKFIGNINDR